MGSVLILLGLIGIAEWSACGFEGAAIFGPQYKNPSSDVPKAIFGSGFVCLFFYIIVQAACQGTLGTAGILAQTISPFVPIAQMTFGSVAGDVLLILLVASMVLCILTCYLVSAGAMQTMAQSGNLPSAFAKLNSRGVPVRAMLALTVFNMFLIFMGNPVAIISAAAFGYMMANGISCFAYYKSKTDPEMSKLPRPFKAPNGYKWVAFAVGLLNIPLTLIGVAYLNGVTSGWVPVIVGVGILLLYIPIWYYSRLQFGRVRDLGKTISDVKKGESEA